jgi:hypothetical protein
MADIFISYSSKDKSVVKTMASLLEEKGWSVWWDRQIPVGQHYDTVIENEIQKAGCVLVVWTQRSVASEWVKNEATAAAQEGKLVPVMLEDVTLPLAFRRTECAMMPGWMGEADHPELEILFSAISDILLNKGGIASNATAEKIKPLKSARYRNSIILSATGLAGALVLLYLYLRRGSEINPGIFFMQLFLSGICVAVFVSGIIKVYALSRQQAMSWPLKITGPLLGILLIVAGASLMPAEPSEKNITIRIFDWKKNPITDGNVKIYLPEYVRSQSVDKSGQALFTGIPAGTFSSNTKIEVTSPGYATKIFDTVLLNSKIIELTLPHTTEVYISGRVKTAAEQPIKGVEINVDGTRYYAVSITDGSYNLRLEEYTLGDEITLTTSHKDYEDKTTSLIINAPSIKNQDIFLNPIAH